MSGLEEPLVDMTLEETVFDLEDPDWTVVLEEPVVVAEWCECALAVDVAVR
jgi:hypothetical protein